MSESFPIPGRIAVFMIVFAIFTTPSFGKSKSTVEFSPADALANHVSSMKPILVAGIAIDNFGVVDGHIYRGSQPGRKDYAALASFGIKTVIDLREDALSSAGRDARAAGLKYINIQIDGHGTPSDSQAAEFLKAVTDPANGVVYVHCAGGRHRTGSMIAVYRMTQDGWDIDRAYQEMLAYDFYTGGGHEGFKSFVFDYYQRMLANPGSFPGEFQAPDKKPDLLAIKSPDAITAK